MQLEFVHTNRPPFIWQQSALTIGRAADNDLVLEDRSIAQKHVILHNDARGLVLDVCSNAQRVYVNARPVRHRALLRPGDHLSIGGCRLRLVERAERKSLTQLDTLRHGAAVAALRGVAGSLAGRVLDLEKNIILDAHGHLATPASVPGIIIKRQGALIELKTQLPVDAKRPRINGIEVEHASIGDGDQIELGTQRFICALVTAANLPPAPAVTEAVPAHVGQVSSRHNAYAVIGLILTACLLSAIVAGLLLLPH